MRPGIDLLDESVGDGALVVRHGSYDVRLRMWLHRGDPVRWTRAWGQLSHARIEDDGTTMLTRLRVDREQMFAGLFYGMHGMRVRGTRRLRVAPHLAYRDVGVPGVIPHDAVLTVEVTVLAEAATR